MKLATVSEFIRSQAHLLLTLLPFIVTYVIVTFVLPLLVGLDLSRRIRRHFRPNPWANSVQAIVIPILTMLVLQHLWPEVFLIVPAAMGLYIAWRMRDYVAGRAPSMAIVTRLCVGIAGVGLVALLLRLLRIGLWDALTMLISASVGYVAGSFAERERFPWGKIVVAGLSTFLTLSVCEALVRHLLPPLPMYYSADAMRMRFPPFDRERGELVFQTPFDVNLDLSTCTPLYADEMPYPDMLRPLSDLWQPESSAAVLHVGDSMVQGIKVASQDRFVTRLQQATPAVRQINLGVSNTAPDFYLLMVQKWMPRLPLQLVIVHLFIGNDIEGLGQPYRCCADGPLLALAGDHVEQRCPSPRWREGFAESLAWFAAVSPSPAIVRQWTPVSQFARYIVATVVAFQKRLFSDPDSGMLGEADSSRADYLESREPSGRPPSGRVEGHWQLFEAVMRTLRDDLQRRGVPLIVSILPLCSALEKPRPKETESYQVRTRMIEVLEALGIETLDPWDDFERLVKEKGRNAVFLPQGDVHLSAKGHEFYAAWLLQRLGSRMGASSTLASPAQLGCQCAHKS